jgi:WhiB family redox-sensing transcriptional regulator
MIPDPPAPQGRQCRTTRTEQHVKAADAEWRGNAACVNQDPELFFPIGSNGPAERQTEGARQVCQSCPVRQPCLEWALEAGADHGVWGGLNEQERLSLRLRRRRNPTTRAAQQAGTNTQAPTALRADAPPAD